MSDPPIAEPDSRRRLLSAMRPRATRAQFLAAVLCAVLGFALVVQVRQTQEQGLATLRQSDLVRILDDVTTRSARLEAEAQRLQAQRDTLRSGTDSAAAAEQAARERLEVLGILAGTAPAAGPGIELVVADPDRQVNAVVLLDTLQELRDAGAEAVQIGTVRVVASTAFVDSDAAILVDGVVVAAPFRVLAIGDPQTLASALEIPGGVLEVLRQRNAEGTVRQSLSVAIDALRTVEAPEYARPAPAPSP
jgi:uncharacterized protein YlxW (UPF0749 family)